MVLFILKLSDKFLVYQTQFMTKQSFIKLILVLLFLPLDDIVDQEVNLESFGVVGDASNDSEDLKLGDTFNYVNHGIDPSS